MLTTLELPKENRAQTHNRNDFKSNDSVYVLADCLYDTANESAKIIDQGSFRMRTIIDRSRNNINNKALRRERLQSTKRGAFRTYSIDNISINNINNATALIKEIPDFSRNSFRAIYTTEPIDVNYAIDIHAVWKPFSSYYFKPHEHILNNQNEIDEKITIEYKKTKLDDKESFRHTALFLKEYISKLEFDDLAIEFVKDNSIKYTLFFGDDKILMINKFLNYKEMNLSENQIMYTFFINRKFIASDVADITDFTKKFTEYIAM